MSDDIWRRRDDDADNTDNYDIDFGSDFGRVQFADDPTSEPALTFGDDATTGSLPHWSEPPTGEIPSVDAEPDVWDTFHSPSTPTRRPERLVIGTDPTGDTRRPGSMRDPSYDMPFDPTGDITGGTSRPTQRPSSVRRTSRPGQRGAAGRDMPAAVSTGLVLLAVFIGAIMWRPAAVMLIVVAVLGLAAVEFFNKVTEKGYRPATFAGIAASVCAPLAAYWRGSTGLVLVLALAFMATTIGFVGSGSVQSGPMPNTAISSLAFVWIGLLGSFAAMILHMSVDGAYPVHTGTDTLFILVAGVVANDVGALFAGSAMGRTPLRDWISPNKTVEGAVGGLLATIVVVFVMGGANGTWDTTKELLLLSIIISIFAPLGDLVESMFKRNLDVKDFGTIVAGHGGILDRFDGFLFVLPSVYYLTLVLEPWVK